MRSMGLCQNGRDRHFGHGEGPGGRRATADYAPWDCLFRKVWQCVGANKGIEQGIVMWSAMGIEQGLHGG